MTRRIRSERVVDLALIALLALISMPILYVGLHPLFGPRYPRVGKIEMRVVPVAMTEARR